MLLQHNIPVYEQLETILSTDNKAIVIMGTGVGKSYVAKEYIDNHQYYALIISPRNSINKSWKKLCGDSVDTITYSKFKNIYKDIDYNCYDVVICDEVHHIGAPKWGIGIRYLIDNKIIPVIGLTENSIRYTDGARDIGEEFFDNNFVIGESVKTAIEKNILNPITYVGALYNSEGIANEIRGKIGNKLYAKLNLAINKTPTVAEIIKTNMPSGKRKGIIFSPTIAEIPECIKFIKNIYPNMKIYPVHSKQPSEINEKYLEWFNKSDQGFLCSVDMLSEGIHLNDINTLFMLRRTESPNVFSQQLGRCLSANNNNCSVLFDLVNNKTNIKISSKSIKVNIPSVFDIKNSADNSISKQIIVKDYTKDIVSVLKEIQDELSLNYWTDEEIELLKNYNHEKYGSLKKWCAKNLSRHSYQSCVQKAWNLGVKLANNHYWTDEEIKILQKYYRLGIDEVKKHLSPNLKRHQIMDKAISLGLHVEVSLAGFTPEDDELIKKYYPTMGYSMAYMIPGKTKRQVASRARDALGLRSNTQLSKYWTETEDKILRENYKNGYVEVMKLLPNRSKDSIMNRAKVLKLPNNVHKKIRCVETGEIYESVTIAANSLGIRREYIYNNLRGKKQSTFGYHWEYVCEN